MTTELDDFAAYFTQDPNDTERVIVTIEISLAKVAVASGLIGKVALMLGYKAGGTDNALDYMIAYIKGMVVKWAAVLVKKEYRAGGDAQANQTLQSML